MIALRVRRPLLGALLTLAGLCACTSGQTASIPTVATPNLSQTGTLGFAVGTATIATSAATASLGLNVVATFRQPNGNNATGVNTPTLTAPRGVSFGPLLGNSNSIAGITPQQLGVLAREVVAHPVPSGTPYPIAAAMKTGFGPFVGVFGYGLAGDNLLSDADLNNVFPGLGSLPCYGVATTYIGKIVSAAGEAGSFYGSVPDVGVLGLTGQKALPGDLVRSAELALPIPSGPSLGNCTCPSTCAPASTIFDDSAFPVQYFGGPPAWPSPQGYGNYSYFVGYPLGFSDFIATPAAGTYTLSVAYPTNSSYTAFGTIAKTAQLSAAAIAAPLPAFPQPTLSINADGSASVTVNVPTGVREAVVTIVTNDCDLTGRDLQGATFYNHYALVTKSTGPQTLFLSALLGPPSAVSGLPTHTFCTLSDVQAYNAIAAANGVTGFTNSFPINSVVAAVGFDYPAYESSYPFNTSAAPTIANAAGQADVTTSYPLHQLTAIAVPSSGS